MDNEYLLNFLKEKNMPSILKKKDTPIKRIMDLNNKILMY